MGEYALPSLVFRSYLGQSSNWANAGESSRQMDYQVWCGPSIGAFNAWVKGTFLENPDNRRVGVIAMNLLYGASMLLRSSQLQHQGIHLPREAFEHAPTSPAEIDELMR